MDDARGGPTAGVRGRFSDRTDAGRRLAELVAELALDQPLVLGLPRGGVPVAFEVARRLHAPLDVLVARKVGAPRQRELAIGAVAEGGGVSIDARAVRQVGADMALVDEQVLREQQEVEQGVARFRGGRPLPEMVDRDVVIVDDGLATGLTAQVAIDVVRRRAPRTLVLAAPVGAPDSVDRLARHADIVVCVLRPERFRAVGVWYDRFDQTSDDEVVSLLAGHGERPPPA